MCYVALKGKWLLKGFFRVKGTKIRGKCSVIMNTLL